MAWLQEVFLIKDPVENTCYLGTDYVKGDDRYCYYGSKTYSKEALVCIESMFGTIPEARTPLPTSDHPEEDNSPLLNNVGHQHYQMLIGMAQWLVMTGRFDIQHALVSQNPFCAAPCKGHWKWALCVWISKKYPNHLIWINLEPPEDPEEPLPISIHDFFNKYPDSCEETLLGLPPPKGVELEC